MIYDTIVDTLVDVIQAATGTTKRSYFDFPPLNDVLCAEDVLAARLDRDAFGRVHPEIKYAVTLQGLRSIRDVQIGANADVKALCAAILKVCDDQA